MANLFIFLAVVSGLDPSTCFVILFGPHSVLHQIRLIIPTSHVSVCNSNNLAIPSQGRRNLNCGASSLYGPHELNTPAPMQYSKVATAVMLDEKHLLFGLLS
jgi:hypothetical protein